MRRAPTDPRALAASRGTPAGAAPYSRPWPLLTEGKSTSASTPSPLLPAATSFNVHPNDASRRKGEGVVVGVPISSNRQSCVQNCCQLLPDCANIRVSRGLQRVPKGQCKKEIIGNKPENLAVLLQVSSLAERQSHRLHQLTKELTSEKPLTVTSYTQIVVGLSL